MIKAIAHFQSHYLGKTLADFLRIQPKKSYQNIERRFLREDTARVFMIQLGIHL